MLISYNDRDIYSIRNSVFVVLTCVEVGMSVTKMFGESAGKIWRFLEEKGRCSESKIKRKTKLSNEEFYGAIGWLAREDKIRKFGRFYELGNTNLVWDIGSRAGRVWRTLNIWGELTEDELAELLDMDKKEVLSALGWLAREGKVEFVNGKWMLK